MQIQFSAPRQVRGTELPRPSEFVGLAPALGLHGVGGDVVRPLRQLDQLHTVAVDNMPIGLEHLEGIMLFVAGRYSFSDESSPLPAVFAADIISA